MVHYKGWDLEVRRQIYYPPFKVWVCWATQYRDKVLFGFNEEGDSGQEALNKCINRIDKNESGFGPFR